MVILALITCTLIMVGCTDNSRARNWGGTLTTNLPKGTKFINATWKDSDMWVLTRPMNTNDVAETFTFQEKSRFGMLEGKVIFVESK